MTDPVCTDLRLRLRPAPVRFWNSFRWARSVGGSLRVSIWYAWKMAAMRIGDV
jgi:hypothetical protein